MGNVLQLQSHSDQQQEFLQNKSLLNGLERAECRRLVEKTDDTLVKKEHNEPVEAAPDKMLTESRGVRGELAEFAYPLTAREKLRLVERFAGEFEREFLQPAYVELSVDENEVPLHPWKKLREIRDGDYGGKKNMSLDKRYALRFVKTFYAERWRQLS